MHRRSFPETQPSTHPRADGAVIAGLALVALATVAAFAALGVAEPSPEGNGVARAYTLEQTDGDTSVTEIDMTETASVGAGTETPSPQCSVSACATAYRSFRASDCTFQPFDGPRRLCTR